CVEYTISKRSGYWYKLYPSSTCFFLQAEDGIRDRNVTGVQTCALPISDGNGLFTFGGGDHPREPPPDPFKIEHSTPSFGPLVVRSEERRVGKEWRSGGSSEESKKKSARCSQHWLIKARRMRATRDSAGS